MTENLTHGADEGTPRATDATVPVIANTGAVAAAGIELQEGRIIPKRQVLSWALWDWAGAAFNAVITTFVFTVYITSSSFIDPAIVAAKDTDKAAYDSALAGLSSGLGLALGIAGVVIALLAPVMGQRSDNSGRRKFWLGINTGVVVVITALLFFAQASPSFFVYGVTLIAIGNVFYEIAGVNYNAMLVQVSTPKSIGKVSGLGWGFGYLGGIVLLLILYVGFIAGDGPYWFGVTSDAGLNIRVVALFAAAWTLVFALPVLLFVPETVPTAPRPKVGFFRSYVVLVKDIGRLYKESRPTFYFLLASAVFRDGLAAVFTFGGVIASVTFGFSSGDVLIFGIVANVVAGAGVILSGLFDDKFGSKPVIIVALSGLIVAGLSVFFARDGGAIAFWIGGLALSLFVGPAQSASRTFLARVTPAGREGEVFGLYATTGRAVSFLAPGLFALFIAWFGAQYWGILGIILVLFVGLLLLLPVKASRVVR
jgi:UMF1 family MFS transporter